MSKLPPSWAEVPFSAITVDVLQRVPLAGEVIRYIDIGSVNRNTKSIESPQELLGKDAPSRARKQVAASDTLVSMTRPNLNAVAMVPKELDGQIASTGFDVLRPVAGIDPRWIGYLVQTEAFVVAMSDLVQGALYPAVRSKDVRAHVVPLAPQAEQIRIANQLDTLLARLKSCNDRLGSIPALLKRFRQTVLDAALSGAGVEADTPTVAISSIASVGTGSTPLRSNSQFFASSGTPWVTSSATSEEIIERANEFVTPAAISAHRLKVYPKGTLLVAMYGEGKTRGQVAELGIDATINQACAAVVVDNKKALTAFVKLALQANYLNMRELAEGGNQPNLNLSKVKEFEIPLPPLKAQTGLVHRVEALFALADRIEARVTAARAQAQRLSPLVLAKGFRGELVPQESTDEPARDLLNQIAAAHSLTPIRYVAKAALRRTPKVKLKDKSSSESGDKPLDATMKLDLVPGNYLETLISAVEGVNAKELWQKSKLDIDEFYIQLSKEIDCGSLEIDAHDESRIRRSAADQRGKA